MYPEFIAIYIGLGVLSILQIGTIILVILLLKKNGGSHNEYPAQKNNYTLNNQSKSSGVALCVNCGTQFDATHKVCPRCGKPR